MNDSCLMTICKLIVETHTAGRKSFAQIGEKIIAEKKIEPEKLPQKDDIYVKTHKQKPGRQYKTPNVEDGSGEQVIKPSHGLNWLLGRSGKCRKTKQDQQQKLLSSSTPTDMNDLKKTIREEIMAEMQEMVDIDRKVFEKIKVIVKLGEINPDFKHLDLEELCASSGDESEDNNDQEDDDREDENHEDDLNEIHDD